jgi:hypothetical protein
MGLGDFSTSWQLLPFFSVIGIVINIIGFRRGAKAGCSGLAIGALGFFATATGHWGVGLAILVALGFITFRPESAVAKAAREAKANQKELAHGTASPSTFRATAGGEPIMAPVTSGSERITTDISSFRATYGDDEQASTGQSDMSDVQQIEEDFIQGRIDRETYVARRRELLS